MAIATNRKQRLRELENDIRTGMEEFYYTGIKLKEIRDDDLYKEDGFETWEKYCRERWEWSARHVTRLITAAEYREKISANGSDRTKWSESSVRELTRIPDKKQAARVAAKIVKEVERSEKEAAKNPDVKPLQLSSSTVRRFVDQDLGVDRAAKAKKTKQKNNGVDLSDYLRNKTGQIEAITERLADIDADVWELLEENDPGVVARLIEAAKGLTELLQS